MTPSPFGFPHCFLSPDISFALFVCSPVDLELLFVSVTSQVQGDGSFSPSLSLTESFTGDLLKCQFSKLNPFQSLCFKTTDANNSSKLNHAEMKCLVFAAQQTTPPHWTGAQTDLILSHYSSIDNHASKIPFIPRNVSCSK